MKFTHYDYKYKTLRSSEDSDSKPYRKITVVSNRHELLSDIKYSAAWICIYSEDKEMREFNLGIDHSRPKQAIKNRCEGRLFLNFIIRGKGTVNGEHFGAGQFFYTLPLETHTIQSDPIDPYVSVWMYVQGDYANYIENELKKKSKNKIMTLDCRTDIMDLTKTFLYTINLGETSTSFLKLLINMYLTYVSPNNELDYPEELATEKISRLVYSSKMYISKNLKTVTVRDLAAYQRYNVKYFSRLFTSTVGMKPAEYITECRLEWAKNSLEHSELSIEEISDTIGYGHRNGFTIAFKKKYGCSPAAYKKKVKEDKNNEK